MNSLQSERYDYRYNESDDEVARILRAADNSWIRVEVLSNVDDCSWQDISTDEQHRDVIFYLSSRTTADLAQQIFERQQRAIYTARQSAAREEERKPSAASDPDLHEIMEQGISGEPTDYLYVRAHGHNHMVGRLVSYRNENQARSIEILNGGRWEAIGDRPHLAIALTKFCDVITPEEAQQQAENP